MGTDSVRSAVTYKVKYLYEGVLLMMEMNMAC